MPTSQTKRRPLHAGAFNGCPSLQQPAGLLSASQTGAPVRGPFPLLRKHGLFAGTGYSRRSEAAAGEMKQKTRLPQSGCPFSGKARFGYERSAKHVGIFRMLAEPFFCIAAGGDGFAARFAQRAGDDSIICAATPCPRSASSTKVWSMFTTPGANFRKSGLCQQPALLHCDRGFPSE